MSELYWPTKAELAAVIVAAALVWGPITAGHLYSPPMAANVPFAQGGNAENQTQTSNPDPYGQSNLTASISQAHAAWAQFFAALATLIAIWWQGRRQQEIAIEQAAIADRQTSILERQEALENRRFELEFRPRLVMTDIRLRRREDDSIVITWELINAGEIDAEITLVTATFGIVDVSEHPMAESRSAWSDSEFRVPQGDAIERELTFEGIRAAYNRRKETADCFFAGRIQYRSVSGPRKYILGFSRTSRGRIPIFRPSEDPQREYSY